MLSQRWSQAEIGKLIVPRDEWRPFATASEREAWDGLPQPLREAQVARGRELLGFDWPFLPAARYLDFARDGNRSRYETLCHRRRTALCDLVMAECTEGQGAFLDEITNGVWGICEESSWCIPAHIGVQRAGRGLPDVTEPIVDLFAAETGALLAWALYLLAPRLDTVSPLIVPRIRREIENRILVPVMERDDFGWMGLHGQHVNNWTPWICSNWLTCALLLEEDETRRAAHVAKAMQVMDKFIDPYPADGGCDEGPGYWGRAGASLYDCLDLLRSATKGAVDVFDEPLIQEIGRFIYRVQIAGRYFVNFADAAAMQQVDPGVTYGYGKAIADPEMTQMGAWLAKDQGTLEKGPTSSLGRRLRTVFYLAEMQDCPAVQPLPRDSWLPVIEVMTTRDRTGKAEGLFVAAKGGHNAESHNHNDVGSFIIFQGGKPVLVDAGVEAYTAKTFSGQRYEIWTMQSAYHNLPTINGVQQAPGKQFAARDARCYEDDLAATLCMDIAGAYPAEAKVKQWVRAVRLVRQMEVAIEDRYELEEVVAETVLHLMTPCEVERAGSGRLVLNRAQLPGGRETGVGFLEYDPDLLRMELDVVPLTEGRLQGIWGERLIRINLRVVSSEPHGEITLRFVPAG